MKVLFVCTQNRMCSPMRMLFSEGDKRGKQDLQHG